MDDPSDISIDLIQPVKKKDEDEFVYDKSKSLDEIYLAELKECVPYKDMRMLTPEKVKTIIHHVGQGLSLFTASSAAGVVPSTVAKYIREGRKRYNEACEIDFDTFEEFEEYIGERGKFFLEINKAKSECVFELHNILMDKAQEAGKEWIPQWLLQIMEPETYSQKFRLEKLKHDLREEATDSGLGRVQFTFIDGMASRPDEDREFMEKRLQELKDIHGDPTTHMDADDEGESGED